MISDLLPFVVTGIVTGSLYGLAATGLVLTYKTSGIFNFAHGAVGAGAAYLFFDLRDRQALPAFAAFIVTVGVIAPLFGLAMSSLAARLATASTVRRVVATVGILLLIQGVVQLRYGITPLPLPSSFPATTFEVFDVLVGYDQVITIAIAVGGVTLLALLFRRTSLGLQMRAVVDNGELLGLTGRAPARVRAASWVIGSSFAALSGILLAFAVGLDALILTLVVVQAFGAAAIGRFSSTTLTFVGGLAIGIAAGILNSPTVTDNLQFLESVPTLDQSLPFIVLFAVLLLTRRGVFRDEGFRRPPRTTFGLARSLKVALLVIAVGVIGLVPALFDTKMPVFTLGAVFITVYASLYLLVEVSGQISLCHVTFVAIGATTFSHLTTGAGLPWLLGVVGAVAVAIPVGALVAVPAIRLSGLFLALATFGFGVLVEQIVYSRGIMFGTLLSRTGSRPAVFGLDSAQGYFYLCMLVAAAAVALVVVVRSSQLGRLLDGLADSPVALLTHGASVNVTRVIVFCLSAAMAGLAGALYVGVTGSVSGSGVSPGALLSFNSLLWLAVLAIVGRNAIVGPVVAAFALIVAPSYSTNPDTAQYLTILFGAASVLSAVFAEDLVRRLVAATPASTDRVVRSPVRERTLTRTHALDPSRAVGA